jgi:prepilin-type processing-associated H-X9-DG protein
MQYLQDYDEVYPKYEQTDANSKSISWPSMIYPYLKNDQIFACPSAPKAPIPSPYNPGEVYRGLLSGDGSDTIYKAVNYLSYSYNSIHNNRANSNQEGWFTNTGTNWGSAAFVKTGFIGPETSSPYTPAKSSLVVEPSSTIMVVDAYTNSGSSNDDARAKTLRSIDWERGTDYGDLSTYGINAHTKVVGRHLDGFNILWGDGHVKWRNYGTTKPQEWSIQAD